MRGEVDDLGPLAQACRILRPRILLQADEARIDIEDTAERGKPHRAVAVVAVSGIAGPDHADAQFVVRAQSRFPGLDARPRGWRHVSRRGRYGLQARGESK